MNEMDVFVRKSANYRIWVDETGVGNIRILKRINFKTLVALFEELHGEIKKGSQAIRERFILFFIYPDPYTMKCPLMQRNSWDSANPAWVSNSSLFYWRCKYLPLLIGDA